MNVSDARDLVVRESHHLAQYERDSWLGAARSLTASVSSSALNGTDAPTSTSGSAAAAFGHSRHPRTNVFSIPQ